MGCAANDILFKLLAERLADVDAFSLWHAGIPGKETSQVDHGVFQLRIYTRREPTQGLVQFRNRFLYLLGEFRIVRRQRDQLLRVPVQGVGLLAWSGKSRGLDVLFAAVV